jgi:capsular exopolysaccharide synthesis family protein
MRNELITFIDPKSPVSEMFRTLRTNLQFMGNSKKIQTILITSTLPGEGKSWTSANLAVTFAQAGKKVILVDSDLRKGRQFSIFNVVARPGVSNYLSGVVNEGEVYDIDDIRSFIRETDIENLYIIPAGDVPPNPAELLVNSRMNQLLLDLKSQYDIIIFDAPPALLVTDATILARMVDTSMIVVAHQETKMDNLNKVQKNIKNVGGNVAGVVINKIPMSVKKYQDSYYGEYYGNPEDMVTTKQTNQDLYLRGKATLLDDRNKSKEVVRNANNTEEDTKIKRNVEKEEPKKRATKTKTEKEPKPEKEPMTQTEELLKKMNEYVEEQKRKINNQ